MALAQEGGMTKQKPIRFWYEGFEYEIRDGHAFGADGLPSRNQPTRRGAKFNEPIIDAAYEKEIIEAAQPVTIQYEVPGRRGGPMVAKERTFPNQPALEDWANDHPEANILRYSAR
jgi:hypothetical protein